MKFHHFGVADAERLSLDRRDGVKRVSYFVGPVAKVDFLEVLLDREVGDEIARVFAGHVAVGRVFLRWGYL